MRIKSAFQFAGLLSLGFEIFGPSHQAVAQILVNQEPVSLFMEPTDKISSHQVYGITPSEFIRQLSRQLSGVGILVAPSREATRLVIDVTSYDSGPYVGLSKTARISLAYQLRKPTGESIASWGDNCEAKVGLNAEDAADRNRTAVITCITALGTRLAEKLAGPRPEVLVD